MVTRPCHAVLQGIMDHSMAYIKSAAWAMPTVVRSMLGTLKNEETRKMFQLTTQGIAHIDETVNETTA